MDPNWVVNHAYNVASYILANDNPIEDGETVDGVEDGQMSRDVQWKCRYEDALIQPPRAVLDINMGEWESTRPGTVIDIHSWRHIDAKAKQYQDLGDFEISLSSDG